MMRMMRLFVWVRKFEEAVILKGLCEPMTKWLEL